MERYLNLSGKSGIEFYELTDTAIIVQFASGQWQYYLYDENIPGEVIVNQMKQLAVSNMGLNTYIKKYVGTDYAAKW